ncbi:hypothetical protein C2845_PM05G33590 [Panicum miliaceum]|uniref:Uncharacterized protein n=1 Tax=Panicum miliaceum TaxID=4540 RepID=A0A3L6SXW9_PANMI|nr:hypothetical protein C2845_PM05G33590 [Panicum miliaceum]
MPPAPLYNLHPQWRISSRFPGPPTNYVFVCREPKQASHGNRERWAPWPRTPCHLVAVPYPGRGHVNAMLNLCRLLAARDCVAITVVVTEEWLGLLCAPAALPDLGPRVHFEAIPDVIPSEHGRASDITVLLSSTDPCLIEDYIPGTKSIRFTDLVPTHTNAAMLDKILEAYSSVRKAQCIILTSFQELESDAIGALRQELPCPVYAAGPCIPFMAPQERKANPDGDGYMAWLDAQPAGSVLYVSLGSFLSVSATQFDEIAGGQAESKVRFLRVLRDADARSRVRGLTGGGDAAGLVVPWTDQLRVLCHPSVGGFFTHCGMNSTLETVYAGVPMLTLPIAFDQPTNNRLIAEVWKTGLGLKEMSRGNGVIGREEIAAAVERLMRPAP